MPRAGLLTIAPCKDAKALLKNAKLPLITGLHSVLRSHRGNLPQPLMEKSFKTFRTVLADYVISLRTPTTHAPAKGGGGDGNGINPNPHL